MATPGRYWITCNASRRTALLVSTCDPCRSTTTFSGSPVATKASSSPRANAMTPMNTATTSPTLKMVITVLKTRTRRFRMLYASGMAMAESITPIRRSAWAMVCWLTR